ncbi:unnamed protein product [Trichogramma brassicae]|uniref:Uncharacterized protein n=1 Tax=Trichogramma brassicae TaxID=86971 RepID=A0A6H5IC10_9HYME|nr:unnamed protein product [Trichogramma brassicae]
MARDEHKFLNKLKAMREAVNWENEEQRRDFLNQLYPLIRSWEGQLPALGDIFRGEEIDWLLIEDAKKSGYPDCAVPIIDFVIRTGYKDELEVVVGEQQLLRRTTALHGARRHVSNGVVGKLFRIYDKFAANYTDAESGLSHFHVACEAGCHDVVEKFLELGQDPDCLTPESSPIDPPLHLACTNDVKNVIRLLLDRGADPNLANAEGLTPLHVICKRNYGDELAAILFDASDGKQRSVLIDAQDKFGQTPLHYALYQDQRHRNLVEMLLRRGANPNLANEDGLTPLHVICMKDIDDDLPLVFFEVCDEVDRVVEIDARDKKGRTPLQWAVANLMPDVVELLLSCGADLSNFVLPTEEHFDKCFETRSPGELQWKLRYASGATCVVQCLERRGFQLALSDALRIVNVFAKYKLLEEPLVEFWYDDVEFVNKAKDLMVKPNLSLYDFIWMLPEEAEKELTQKNYVKLEHSSKFWEIGERIRQSCISYLCDLMVGGFLERLTQFTPDFFWALTRYRLPILCSRPRASAIAGFILSVNNSRARSLLCATRSRAPILRSMREEINWEIEEDRIKFLRRFDPAVWYTERRLPNLRDIFRDEEIECLLSDFVRHKMHEDKNPETDPFVSRFTEFVARTGYRDEPRVDEDGEPLSLRTTPLHLVLRNRCLDSRNVVGDLFQIYHDFGANYTDDLGFTHLHVACEFRGHHLVVERFLERGQDPNGLWPGTSDSLLHVAMSHQDEYLARVLLRHGADRHRCTLFAGEIYATAKWQRCSSRPTPTRSSGCRSTREISRAGHRCNWPWRISCRT